MAEAWFCHYPFPIMADTALTYGDQKVLSYVLWRAIRERGVQVRGATRWYRMRERDYALLGMPRVTTAESVQRLRALGLLDPEKRWGWVGVLPAGIEARYPGLLAKYPGYTSPATTTSRKGDPLEHLSSRAELSESDCSGYPETVKVLTETVKATLCVTEEEGYDAS